MPRDLSDVLHYLLPEADGPASASDARMDSRRRRVPAPERSAPIARRVLRSSPPLRAPALPLPILSVLIGDRDVVRAAFAWNLAVEVARTGGRAALIAPALGTPSPLWPEPGVGPLGAELVLVPASGGLDGLYRAAVDVAVTRAESETAAGLVLVRCPPDWLDDGASGAALLRWVLCFASADPRDLSRTRDLTSRVARCQPAAKLGVVMHGANRREQASRAFAELTRAAQGHCRKVPENYGLLVDDLDVYRAIVARRPIGLAHPRSPAAQSLRELARRLLAEPRRSNASP